MMVTWMLYATAMALLLGLTAWTVEYALRAFNRQARWGWIVALTLSVTLPVVLARRPAPAVQPLVSSVATVAPTIVTSAPATLQAPAFTMPDFSTWDRPLLILWLVASVIAALVLLVGHWRLRRDVRRWPAEVVDDCAVHVSPAMGPAVIGAWRGVVVLPNWARELRGDWRRLVVSHEAEHVKAGDARLLAAAAIAVVLCPWNLALWWQRARLRDAVELDCDLRVLKAGADPAVYGALLLDVARRASNISLAAVALAAPRSLLARRIAMLTNVFTRARLARAGAALIVGGVLIAIACEAPAPTAPIAPQTVAATADTTPRLVSNPAILYPPLLKEAGIQGRVTIQALVKKDGSVDSASARVVASVDRRLGAQALQALRHAVFKPAIVNGKPTAMLVHQDVYFLIAKADGTHDPVNDTTGRALVIVTGDVPTRTPAPRPGGFDVTTSEYTGPSPGVLHYHQDLPYPPLLFESGIAGQVTADFSVLPSGKVDRASVRFAPGADARFQAVVSRSLAAADFSPYLEGKAPATHRVRQTVEFSREGSHQTAKPHVKATTIWDYPGTPPTFHADTGLVFVRPVGQPMPSSIDAVDPHQMGEPDSMPVLIGSSIWQALRYPPLLLEAGIEGKVVLAFTVMADGTVDPGTIRANATTRSEFASIAKSAFRNARFSPATLRGQPIPVGVGQEVYFHAGAMGSVSREPAGFLPAVIVTGDPAHPARE